MKNTLVLEKSTNTHLLEGEISNVKNFGNGDFLFDTDGFVTHGEHATIKLNGRIMKINQQEFNPVTKSLQNAFD